MTEHTGSSRARCHRCDYPTTISTSAALDGGPGIGLIRSIVILCQQCRIAAQTENAYALQRGAHA